MNNQIKQINDNQVKQQMDQIETIWFKDHVATLQMIDHRITRIYWNKLGLKGFSIVYLIDENNLFVTGDLGEAIYSWSGKIDLHFLRNCELDYFKSKCKALSECNSKSMATLKCASHLIGLKMIDRQLNNQ